MQLSWTVYFWGWHILKLKRAGHLCCCMGYSYLRVRENYIICYLVLVLSWASSGFSVSFWLKDHHCRNMSLKLSGKERKFRHWFWAGSYYLFIYFSSKWDSVCEGKVTCFNLEGEGGPRKLWFNYLSFLHCTCKCYATAWSWKTFHTAVKHGRETYTPIPNLELQKPVFSLMSEFAKQPTPNLDNDDLLEIDFRPECGICHPMSKPFDSAMVDNNLLA